MTDAPAVKLRNLGKRFKDGAGAITVLKDVNLEVFPGELVALLGPSGSGKSTLLHLMGALDVHYEGSVAIQGQELKAMKDRERSAFRSEKIGFVFQAYHLLGHFSALENVLLAATFSSQSPDSGRARELLRAVGLEGKEERLSSRLSGGEKQRVAIARALYHNPPIVLCDEPTGNLDTQSAAEVLSILKELRSEKSTIVIVTHDEDVASHANRTYKLSGGGLC